MKILHVPLPNHIASLYVQLQGLFAAIWEESRRDYNQTNTVSLRELQSSSIQWIAHFPNECDIRFSGQRFAVVRQQAQSFNEVSAFPERLVLTIEP